MNTIIFKLWINNFSLNSDLFFVLFQIFQLTTARVSDYASYQKKWLMIEQITRILIHPAREQLDKNITYSL